MEQRTDERFKEFGRIKYVKALSSNGEAGFRKRGTKECC